MRFLTLVLASLLVACASGGAGMSELEHSQTQGWHLKTFQVSELMIVGLQKPFTPTQAVLHVYIEGDGFAWAAPDQPSSDPTPHQGLGLQLAKLDPRAQVLYLARPCQYSARKTSLCNDDRWWTNARYSRVVVDSYHQILNRLKQESPDLQFELIGYSGGAAIASILAAERKDIVGLRTVAGNLDTERVNQAHKVSSMRESLNPMTFAPHLKVKQLHYTGRKDSVIPRQVATGFVQAQAGACAAIIELDNASHWQGWLDVWPDLLKQPWPACPPKANQAN
jgi:hypothetical protein